VSEGVSTFLNVGKAGTEYIFLLLNFRPNGPKQAEIFDQLINQFGADLETKGRVIRAYAHKFHNVLSEVLDKPWPDDTAKKIEESTGPFLVIIDQDFTRFDPRTHDWAIEWFSSSLDPERNLRQIFTKIVRLVRSGGDVFGISDGDQVNSLEQVNDPATVDIGQVSVADEGELIAQARNDTSSSSPSPMPRRENGNDEKAPENAEADHLINDKEVARLTAMSLSWVRKERHLRNNGKAHVFNIDPVMVGTSPRYKISEVSAWIKAR
jgi:hypothetical protein